MRSDKNLEVAKSSLESIQRESVLRFKHAKLHTFGGLLQYGLDLLSVVMVKSSLPLFESQAHTDTDLYQQLNRDGAEEGRDIMLRLYRALLYRKVTLA